MSGRNYIAIQIRCKSTYNKTRKSSYFYSLKIQKKQGKTVHNREVTDKKRKDTYKIDKYTIRIDISKKRTKDSEKVCNIAQLPQKYKERRHCT